MTNEKLTRDQQREQARAKAKAMREAQRKSAAAKKITIMISSVIAGVALVGVVIWGILGAAQQASNDSSAPRNAIFNNGIMVTKDLQVVTSKTQVDSTVPNIIVYEDLQCPICKEFELPNMAQIKDLVSTGKYTLELHPISFLDGHSVNQYSSRAASALLSVADSSPQFFFAFNQALYENQPAENTSGPSNDDLAALAKKVGVTSTETLNNIKSAKFATWAQNKTPAYLAKLPGSAVKFSGTPTIVIGDQQYQGDYTNPAMFLQWLQTVAPVSATN